MAKAINSSIRNKEGIVKEVHGDGEKGEMLANQARDWTST
jgi:hypothetical protein